MPQISFKFRAYCDSATPGALKAQLALGAQIYNEIRDADNKAYKSKSLGRNKL